jgi:hypothetical protein
MSSIFLRGAALAALVAVAGPAQAEGNVGWLWANQPGATGAYTPNTSYSYNSRGGSISVTPGSTGVYTVSFAGLHIGRGSDDVQVTPYDTSGYCMIGGWGNSSTTVNASVYCFDASGNPANTYFDLLYQERTGIFGTGNKGLAFVYAHEASVSHYTPNSAYQYNSTGGTNTVTHNDTGNYTVDIPGLSNLHSSVQVSTVGLSTTPARCKVFDWMSDGSSGTNINVICFNSSGVAADELFTVDYAVEEPFGLVTAPTTPGAWANANNPTRTTFYYPNSLYQYNGFATGRLTSQRTGSGAYTVNIPGSLSYNTSNVLVTAYGHDSSYCNSSGWYPINVTCYAQGGATINELFDAAYQTSK